MYAVSFATQAAGRQLQMLENHYAAMGICLVPQSVLKRRNTRSREEAWSVSAV